MPSEMTIRRATVADAGSVARHRAAMFVDMGALTAPTIPEFIVESEAYVREAIARDEYLGWLAFPVATPDYAVAGAGVQLRRVLPFPRRHSDGRCDIAEGRQAVVLNVYTEPAFRRRGFARRLLAEILNWARLSGLESLVLYATPDGRPLYEQLGFVAANEMRFAGELAGWSYPGNVDRHAAPQQPLAPDGPRSGAQTGSD
jgi:GNAT superfamily N-acetyltransferase